MKQLYNAYLVEACAKVSVHKYTKLCNTALAVVYFSRRSVFANMRKYAKLCNMFEAMYV